MLEPARIVGVSKTTYALATPRSLNWMRGPNQTSTNNTPRIRARRIRAAGVLVVIAAIAVAVGYQLPASSSSAASSRCPRRCLVVDAHITDRRPSQRARDPRSERRGPLGEADGAVPTARRSSMTRFPVWPTSIQRSSVPCAKPRLMPRTWGPVLRRQRLAFSGVPGAATPAGGLKYGSEEEAARWVATPSTSAHVSGDAVDIGRSDATAWLSEHGAEYGLCQIYSNEPWHYELRPAAVDHGCPPMYADPTHDPRTQQ